MRRDWWNDRTLWIGLAGLGGLVAAMQFAGLDPVGEVSFAVKDIVGKGNRLSYSSLDASGTVREDPEALRQAASVVMGRDVDRNVYALARMLRSEGAKQGALRVHVALNDLAHLGWADSFDLITYSTVAAQKGRYGRQLHRRYASGADPYQADVVTVEQAIADHDAGVDPSQGATKFVDKSSMGIQPGSGTFDALVERWAAEGLEPYTLPEYGEDLVLFKKA